MNPIAVAKVFKTAAVVSYKSVNDLNFIISGHSFIMHVSLILESLPEGPGCDRPNKPQALTRVVNGYDPYLYDDDCAALELPERTRGIVKTVPMACRRRVGTNHLVCRG